MTSRQLHEMIDACRPGHADEAESEFSELAEALARGPQLQRVFDHSQDLDAAIRASFRTVVPPPGLAERLLAAIDAAAVDTSTIEEDANMPAPVERASRDKPLRHFSRRRFAIGGGILSLAAVAAVVFYWFQFPSQDSFLTDVVIAERVEQWNDSLDETAWQAAASIPSQDFPTWQHLDARSVAGWQWVSKHRIACYDFAIDEAKVRLFVWKPTAPLTLSERPSVGYPSPSGWHVGAWQANGRVYFLAVRANGNSKQLYSELVASQIRPA